MGKNRDYILSVLYSFANRPYITQSLSSSRKPLLIHISDTPGFVYPFIYRLVEKLEPEILVHTGDMIDDLKLEIRPALVKEYAPKLEKIIRRLEKLPVKQIYMIPGNHDNMEVMKKLSERSEILPEKSRIEAEGISFFLSHEYFNMKTGSDFYLFGHSLPAMGRINERSVRLNGIPYINIISLSTKNTYTLKYPPGTDSARTQLLTGIGL